MFWSFWGGLLLKMTTELKFERMPCLPKTLATVQTLNFSHLFGSSIGNLPPTTPSQKKGLILYRQYKCIINEKMAFHAQKKLRTNDSKHHRPWKSSQPNTSWLGSLGNLGMIHGSRIPDPSEGQAVWSTWTSWG